MSDKCARDEEAQHEEHEGVEGHEGRRQGYRMRVPSPLSARTEAVMTEVIGCAIAVHTELGPGFIEAVYHKAMCVEFAARKLAYESERSVTVTYRGTPITGQRVDLIVENQVIVELKCVLHWDEIHRQQLVSYLRTTGLRGGLLVNFRTTMLKHGIRRVVI